MKRELFKNIRRCYRIAQKLSALRDGNAVAAKVAATTAMRQLTGKWDCCEPVRYNMDQFTAPKNTRLWVRRPFVAAACTRWLASH